MPEGAFSEPQRRERSDQSGERGPRMRAARERSDRGPERRERSDQSAGAAYSL